MKLFYVIRLLLWLAVLILPWQSVSLKVYLPGADASLSGTGVLVLVSSLPEMSK